MKITERDLFDFVFSPEKLSSETFIYLKNSDKFNSDINFYSSLKESFAEELSDSLKLKIALKIPAYKPPVSVLLFPVENAGSFTMPISTGEKDEEEETSSQIFADKKKGYILKLLNYKTHCKLFTFNTSGNKLSNFKIKFHPGSSEHNCADNNNPLRIDKVALPENIELLFNE